MGWDLWGPSHDIVAEESGVDNSQCDFYFGYGFDVIEEEALNEKHCVQVLRVLIKKADTEILELEQDLLSLQTELAWVENEDWSDICCNALREKIDFLDISVKNLRNKEKNDMVVRLLIYTQPVETLDEVLKHKDAIVLGSSSVTTQHATNSVDEENRLNNCNLETTKSEKTKDCGSTPTEHSAILNPSLNHQEKKTGNSKPANANFEGFTQQFSEVAPDCSDEKKSLSFCCPRSTGKRDAREHELTPKDEKLIQSSSLKSAYEGRHSLKPVKVERWIPDDEQPTENSASNSTIYASENAAAPSCEEKAGDSDSIATKEVEEHSSISTADVVISGSSSKPMPKKTDLRKIVKPASIVDKDFGLSANMNAASHSSEMKILVMSDLRVIGNKEATELQSRAIGESRTLSSSLNLEGRRNNPRTDDPAGAAGLNGRKHNSDCALGTFKRAKGSSADIEQKLCEFAPKAAQKRTVKESKISAAHDMVSLKSLRKTNGKRKTPLIMKLRETDLTDTENCALTSLLEMQDHEGENAANLQPEEEKPIRVEVQTTEISADEKRSILNLSLNPQKKKGKRNIKSNTPILHEIGFSKLILNSSSSSISESNKKRKFGAGPQNASLNQYLSGKITKKAVWLDKGEAKEHGGAEDDTANLVSEPQKEEKVCVNFPHSLGTEDSSVQMDLSSSLGGTIDGSSKDDLSVDESCSICDSSSEVVPSFTSAISSLRDLRLAELRTIAGRLKLTKYSKLRKELLLELIAERLAH
ncbi:unnamed protein product [Dovyalis caffra]|uniref:Rho termination factor N-terminal domain-containing protein n=1 Tax=Dovyalis caffra TaxID=77055 RepID=A0AAV1RYN2_9ROSI|nr:unnamed protein product [Dovyalis caffra]